MLFNSQGDCLAAKLRPGNVHSADDWEELLISEIGRQQKLGKEVVFRADAGRRTSEPAAVRDHAGLYCPIASTAGINKAVEVTQSLAVKSVSAAIPAAWNVAKPGTEEAILRMAAGLQNMVKEHEMEIIVEWRARK